MQFQPTLRSVWRVSLPLVFVEVGETLIEVTDALFLAHYGVVELGAVALADALLGVAFCAIVGLVDGLQITMGRRAGENRPRALGRAFNQGVYLLAIGSFALTVLIELGAPLVTALVVSSAEVRAAVDEFVRIAALGTFFEAMGLAYAAFYCGISRTRVLVAATAVAVVVNIVLDHLLVFGNLGLPELGIRGAALGSLLAEASAFALLTTHLLVRGYPESHGVLRFGAWNRRLTARLLSISWPVSLEALVETLRWFVFFVIVEQLGEHALGAANVVYSCYALFLIPVGGFSETACTMVSNLIGQGRSRDVAPLLRKIVGACAVLVLPLGVVALVLTEALVSVFTTDPEVAAAAVTGLRIVALALLVVVPGEILSNGLAGTGATGAVLVLELVTTGVIIVCAAAALRFELPTALVWLAEPIGGALALTLSLLLLRRGAWARLRV